MDTLKKNGIQIVATVVIAGSITFFAAAVIQIIALTNAGFINWSY